MCFRPAKTRKNLELFEVHTCHWPGAQICFRHKWRKLFTASLLLHCIGWYSCFRYWNEFFSTVFQVLDWSFLKLHFDGNVCDWFPKVIWPRMDWFWGFVRKWLFSLTSYLYGLESATLAHLLIVVDDIKFFRCFVRGVFWSVLQKCLYFFAVDFCNIDWYVLGMQFNFIFFFLFLPAYFSWK